MIQTVDNNIESIRIMQGMSRVALAERCNLTYAYIYALETGRRHLMDTSVRSWLRISYALNLDDPMVLLKLEEGED